MPSQSTLSGDEKAKLKSVVSAPSHKITYAALARIYYAHPQPNKWAYAGLQGALALCTNNATGTMHMKMVDLDGTRGVIWDQELYDGFEMNQDRAFFLSFEGDVRASHSPFMFPFLTRLQKCTIGFVFADESEAKTFNKKVKERKEPKARECATFTCVDLDVNFIHSEAEVREEE